MKKIILLLVCSLACNVLTFAQQDTTKEKSSTKIIIKDRDSDDDEPDTYIDFNWHKCDDDPDKIVKTRWGMLDLGISTYIKDGDLPTIGDGIDPMEQKIWGSWNLNIHIIRQRISLINRKFNIMWGLSADYHEYEFSNNVRLVDDVNEVTFVEFDPDDYDRNELRNWFLTLPVMFNLETKPDDIDRSFRLSAGAYAGLRMKSRYKQHFENSRVKTSDDFNTNQFRYGLIGEIGFGPVTLYANYALNGLFEEDDDAGFVVNPLNVGVKVIPF